MQAEQRQRMNALQLPIPLGFDLLSKVPGLAHGVFTRHGGVSRPPYATLNTAWNNGDSPDAVRENLMRINDALAFSRLVTSPQVHGDTIRSIDEEALLRAEKRFPILVTQPGDALVTCLRGVGLVIKIADCQAIFLVDPTRRVVANVHSGWRGSGLNLAGKTVQFLKDRFGCHPGDILATVSPSLGPCCAEFRNYRNELPEEFFPYQVKPLHFDFWAIARRQLTEAGIEPEHIEIAGRCTVCETEDFFSYRGEKPSTGRMAAVIGWKPDTGE